MHSIKKNPYHLHPASAFPHLHVANIFKVCADRIPFQMKKTKRVCLKSFLYIFEIKKKHQIFKRVQISLAPFSCSKNKIQKSESYLHLPWKNTTKVSLQ